MQGAEVRTEAPWGLVSCGTGNRCPVGQTKELECRDCGSIWLTILTSTKRSRWARVTTWRPCSTMRTPKIREKDFGGSSTLGRERSQVCGLKPNWFQSATHIWNGGWIMGRGLRPREGSTCTSVWWDQTPALQPNGGLPLSSTPTTSGQSRPMS